MILLRNTLKGNDDWSAYVTSARCRRSPIATNLRHLCRPGTGSAKRCRDPQRSRDRREWTLRGCPTPHARWRHRRPPSRSSEISIKELPSWLVTLSKKKLINREKSECIYEYALRYYELWECCVHQFVSSTNRGEAGTSTVTSCYCVCHNAENYF